MADPEAKIYDDVPHEPSAYEMDDIDAALDDEGGSTEKFAFGQDAKVDTTSHDINMDDFDTDPDTGVPTEYENTGTMSTMKGDNMSEEHETGLDTPRHTPPPSQIDEYDDPDFLIQKENGDVDDSHKFTGDMEAYQQQELQERNTEKFQEKSSDCKCICLSLLCFVCLLLAVAIGLFVALFVFGSLDRFRNEPTEAPGVPTTIPPPTLPPIEKIETPATIRLNKDYNSNYDSPSSPEYKQLEYDIKQIMNEGFESNPKTQSVYEKVEVEGFSSGSIIADLRVIFTGAPPTDDNNSQQVNSIQDIITEVQALVVEVINNADLTSIDFDSGSLVVRPPTIILPPDSTDGTPTKAPTTRPRPGVSTEAPQCQTYQFACANWECIYSFEECNGVDDCGDNSDEHDLCGVCSPSEFQCTSGICISGTLKCDGNDDCQDNSDEQDCPTQPPPGNCLEYQFECGSGECIFFFNKCDGNMDCGDSSDEMDCPVPPTAGPTTTLTIPPTPQCSPFRWPCANGQCIFRWQECNGVDECGDGSDEHDQCEAIVPTEAPTSTEGTPTPGNCLSYQFECGSGECIFFFSKCNGDLDCADGSDEVDCPTPTTDPNATPPPMRNCPAYQFECESGQCVPILFLCDGDSDCQDGSDESRCVAPTIDPTATPPPMRNCPVYQFECGSGECVGILALCDDKLDCQDGSDESRCVAPTTTPSMEPTGTPTPGNCLSHQFECGSGECIFFLYKCNGIPECADGSDEVDCPTCTPFEFECSASEDCIAGYLQCDNNEDCEDGSDELDCPTYPPIGNCQPHEFECESGDCIFILSVCNGIPECEDGSDETICGGPTTEPTGSPTTIPPTTECPYQVTCSNECGGSGARKYYNGCPTCECVEPLRTTTPYTTTPGGPCGTDEFPCSDGTCLPNSWQCDSENDCGDFSDEIGCECTENEFECFGGECINSQRMCDGQEDCIDGSDETAELCNVVCTEGQLLCNDGRTCYSETGRCNSVQDCPDYADDLYCDECQADAHLCANDFYRACIPISNRCNYIDDCGDNSDEVDCVCDVPVEFQCVTGGCVNSTWVCDGEADCYDRSDETIELCGVPTTTTAEPCGTDKFTCADGKCIPNSWQCDFHDDCGDFSDEIGCVCDEDALFECIGGGCIPGSWVCDDAEDCIDGSDEAAELCNVPTTTDPALPCGGCLNGGSCENYFGFMICICPNGYEGERCENPVGECQTGEFQCPSTGVCVAESAVCDGNFDCDDLSDESPTNCPCNGDTVSPCADGSGCILNTWFCNGVSDCTDGSDELNCPTGCRIGEFSCGNGDCISLRQRCNQVEDCEDGSDELMCDDGENLCDSMPCLNGGSCEANKGVYRCTCPVGFTGQNCETNTDVDACLATPCQNDATCITVGDIFQCTCKPGFTGPLCETDINYCDSNPCQNGGICADGELGYYCICMGSYVGPNCENAVDGPCTTQPCMNGGSCEETGDSYVCNCAPGWFGDECQIEIDECSSEPCLNMGTCIDGINSYTCNCRLGFVGDMCEMATLECTSEPCQNGGTCFEGTNSYFCFCTPGYTGSNCETVQDLCDSSPCLNGATCVFSSGAYTCECYTGYTGVNCETVQDLCASSPCLNGATCVSFSGAYTCSCYTGYIGVNCETVQDVCDSSPCLNDATCVSSSGAYTCECYTGYTGVNCETVQDLCDSSPCLNGATCVSSSGAYTCECYTGYTGVNCETAFVTCAEGESMCPNGRTCYAEGDICDGYPNCGNGADSPDEKNCSTSYSCILYDDYNFGVSCSSEELLPYMAGLFPNFLTRNLTGFATAQDASRQIRAFNRYRTCDRNALQLMCGITFPQCPIGNSVVAPCRQLCLEILDKPGCVEGFGMVNVNLAAICMRLPDIPVSGGTYDPMSGGLCKYY